MTIETVGHTPGPWKVEVEGTMSGRWLSIIAEENYYDDGSPHELFRSETVEVNRNPRALERWEPVGSAEEIRANGRLIAATPELLEALQRVLSTTSTIEVLGEWSALDMNHHRAGIERVKVDGILADAAAAIAKAVGS